MNFVAVAFILLFCLRGEARFADSGDLGSVHESETAEIIVDRRGHSRLVIERTIRINNDEGRESEGVQVVDFNARSMRFKVLAAHTVNGEKIVPVKPSAIEIRAVGDSSNSFDVQKKAKLTYPDLRAGSKIYLKYQIDTDEVADEGFFSFFADFNGWYIERYRLRIRSRLPLHFWKNDPQGLLDVSVRDHGRLLEARTNRAVRLRTAREEEAFIRPNRSLALLVSSLERWEDYARATIVRHETLLRAPLPALLAKIKMAAAEEAHSAEKIDRVAAEIAQNFRYFADWRRRRGGFVPRALKEIAETRYGDCKDLSLAATAVLRALGFKAEIAWVIRGEAHAAFPFDWYRLPFDGFNHAVVRVEDADSKVYWVDATEPVSHALAVSEEIAGRPVFVLRRERPGIEFVRELAAADFEVEKKFGFTRNDDQSMRVEGSLSLKGRAAEALTQDAFYKSKETLDYDLIHSLAAGYRILDSRVGEFARGSRVVKDVTIDFKFTAADAGLRTNNGSGVVLPRETALERLFLPLGERASDIFIDVPGRWVSRLELAGVRRQGKIGLDCDLQNEWVKVSRKVSDTAGGIEVIDRVEILKSVVPNEKLHTTEFTEFQRRLHECFYRVALIVEPF